MNPASRKSTRWEEMTAAPRGSTSKDMRKRRFARSAGARVREAALSEDYKALYLRPRNFKRSNMKITRGCISRKLKLARRIEKRPTKYSAQVDRVVTTKAIASRRSPSDESHSKR